MFDDEGNPRPGFDEDGNRIEQPTKPASTRAQLDNMSDAELDSLVPPDKPAAKPHN